jgi:hypothetical protein
MGIPHLWTIHLFAWESARLNTLYHFVGRFPRRKAPHGGASRFKLYAAFRCRGLPLGCGEEKVDGEQGADGKSQDEDGKQEFRNPARLFVSFGAGGRQRRVDQAEHEQTREYDFGLDAGIRKKDKTQNAQGHVGHGNANMTFRQKPGIIDVSFSGLHGVVFL